MGVEGIWEVGVDSVHISNQVSKISDKHAEETSRSLSGAGLMKSRIISGSGID